MFGVFLGGVIACIAIGKPNNAKRYSVLFLALVVAIISGTSLYSADKESKESIDRLSRFGSYIDWDKSFIKYQAYREYERLNQLQLSARVKVISNSKSVLGSKIDKQNIIRRSKSIHAFEFKELLLQDAGELFLSHSIYTPELDGNTIYKKTETDSNIYTFNFYTSEVTKNHNGHHENLLKYHSGANARTGFRSLYDLNDSFILVHIGGNKPLSAGSIFINLKTNLGNDLILFNITEQMTAEYKNKALTLGVYIPEQYWSLE